MDYINIITNILKESKRIINSTDFKNTYASPNSFVRKRKLSFTNCFYFIMSGLRKSLSAEISQFSQKYKQLNFCEISKQSLSKAKQNISYEAFAFLYNSDVSSFYQSGLKFKKWHGFNVFAIDGTSIQIPDTKENINVFGCKKISTIPLLPGFCFCNV